MENQMIEKRKCGRRRIPIEERKENRKMYNIKYYENNRDKYFVDDKCEICDMEFYKASRKSHFKSARHLKISAQKSDLQRIIDGENNICVEIL